MKLKVLVFEFGSGDVMEGLGATFEEKVVEGFGLVEAKGAKLFRDGKGDHEVRGS